MNVCNCTLGITNPEACKTCGNHADGILANTTYVPTDTFEIATTKYVPADIKYSVKNNDVRETKIRRVSKLGTVTITQRLAGKRVAVRDNGDGTYTVITLAGE